MKKPAILLLLLFTSWCTYACSTFLLNKNGQLAFGRNYDWVTGNGMILVNASGLVKNSFMQGSAKRLNWTSLYGSVTFNQFGKEFPHGGMNEKGLVVELMWLEGTSYPAADQRAAVNELQWIQYQLDNCATIAEVIASDKKIRIDRNNATPLHYLVADANGQAAAIEFLDGKMVVHQGKDLAVPVLTNSTYQLSVAQLQPATKAAYSNNSLDRFTQACSMIRQYNAGESDAAPVDYAFNILDKVSQGDFTKWSIVYDITNKKINFITNGNTQRRSVSFSALGFKCSDQCLFADLNAPLKGDIFTSLKPLTAEQNQLLVARSAEECKSRVQIPEEAITALGGYFSSTKCQ